MITTDLSAGILCENMLSFLLVETILGFSINVNFSATWSYEVWIEINTIWETLSSNLMMEDAVNPKPWRWDKVDAFKGKQESQGSWNTAMYPRGTVRREVREEGCLGHGELVGQTEGHWLHPQSTRKRGKDMRLSNLLLWKITLLLLGGENLVEVVF